MGLNTICLKITEDIHGGSLIPSLILHFSNLQSLYLRILIIETTSLKFLQVSINVKFAMIFSMIMVFPIITPLVTQRNLFFSVQLVISLVHCHIPRSKSKDTHHVNSDRQLSHLCNTCGASFNSVRGLGQHERHRHPLIRNLKCIEQRESDKLKEKTVSPQCEDCSEWAHCSERVNCK